MTELWPVLEESEFPPGYTDEPDDGVSKSSLSKRRPSQTSLDVLFHDRITLTWENINVYVVPDATKCCRSFRRKRPAETTQYKQILHNGLSRIIIITVADMYDDCSTSNETIGMQ